MAKKKNKLGKLLAFTTTVAAIGGTCYIFRDKIKQSPIYKTVLGKLSDLSSNCCNNDDFFFDDEDEDFDNAFPENAEHGREYTSITINAKKDCTKDDTPAETATGNKTSENGKTSEKDISSETNKISEESVSSEDNTVTGKEQASKNDETPKENTSSPDNNSSKEDTAFSSDGLIEIFPKDSISNITSGKASDKNISIPEKNTSSSEKKDYENKGLSDVSEDPDTLEEQDKLDF